MNLCASSDQLPLQHDGIWTNRAIVRNRSSRRFPRRNYRHSLRTRQAHFSKSVLGFDQAIPDQCSTMKPDLTILFATMILLAAPMVLRAQPLPPIPAIPALPSEDDGTYSPSNFKRALSDLRAEREALDAEWRAITKRLSMPQPSDVPDLDRLHLKIKELVARLQRERMELKATPTAAPNIQPKNETPRPEPKKTPDPESIPTKPAAPTSSNGPVDVVQLAQTLFRAERYEEALGVFRSVDLKGKKPEERAPIVYLTADCLHRLGKTDEAVAMLREVANSRGDEHMAEYAQWQIENLRWHREVQNKLADIRRRLGTGVKR